jgi:hypothetical protein
MKDLIPHQLHLTRKQINALNKGSATNVPFSHMGSGAGDIVVMLHPQNARKLLTSYKKGKGMRLKLSPDELETSMIHGSGFNIGKAFKKLGSDIKKGFNILTVHWFLTQIYKHYQTIFFKQLKVRLKFLIDRYNGG